MFNKQQNNNLYTQRLRTDVHGSAKAYIPSKPLYFFVKIKVYCKVCKEIRWANLKGTRKHPS